MTQGVRKQDIREEIEEDMIPWYMIDDAPYEILEYISPDPFSPWLLDNPHEVENVINQQIKSVNINNELSNKVLK